MAVKRPEIILGAAPIGSIRFLDVESSRHYYEMFDTYGTHIDHARIYLAEAPEQGEQFMQLTGASEWARWEVCLTNSVQILSLNEWSRGTKIRLRNGESVHQSW